LINILVKNFSVFELQKLIEIRNKLKVMAEMTLKTKNLQRVD